MANVVVYLEGGPCAKKLHTLKPGETDSGATQCKGGVYLVSNPARHRRGHLVFVFSQKQTDADNPPKLSAAKLHKGYADVQHSVNHNMPAALKRSHRSLSAGLRSVHRARKVKL